jgi:hypothetical protein
MAFNLFRKKEKGPVFSDRAYMTEPGKMTACYELAIADPSTIFVAWFPETARKFKTFFVQRGLEDNRILEKRNLHSETIVNKTVVFVEHYPVHQKEMDLVENWPQDKFTVYNSLDEPLFKHFGSEKMLPVMKMLGMKEDEAIEHSMVTKSIVRAQEKIASKVNFEQSANSQQEWLLKNLQ